MLCLCFAGALLDDQSMWSMIEGALHLLGAESLMLLLP